MKNNKLVKNKSAFAIESSISIAYYQESIRAIGYFLIRINGIFYGVKDDYATALACSYDEVIKRLGMRGKHTVPVAFTTTEGNKVIISTLTELIISSDEYYLTLKEWADGFYKEWQNSEKVKNKEFFLDM